jgi:enterochelin esterase-like enzyme
MRFICETFDLPSTFLGERRKLSVFLPQANHAPQPLLALYCADGQMLAPFADALAAEGARCPLVALVGVESNVSTRPYDYVHGYDRERFAAHERFLIEEIVPLVEAVYRIGGERGARGLFGYSDGGAFVHAAAVRNPTIFGFAIAFSVSDKRVRRECYPSPLDTAFYLSAGAREPDYRNTTASIAADLQFLGIQHKLTERDAGHETTFWSAELPLALSWVIARQPPSI